MVFCRDMSQSAAMNLDGAIRNTTCLCKTSVLISCHTGKRETNMDFLSKYRSLPSGSRVANYLLIDVNAQR